MPGLIYAVHQLKKTVVFFRDPGKVSDLLPIPWRSQLQSGNELGNSRCPAHQQYLAFQWQRQRGSFLLKQNHQENVAFALE